MQLITIGGRLAADAELSYTQSGTGILKFTLVCNSRVKEGGEWVEHAQYYRCAYFGGKRCEGLLSLMTKGSIVNASGELTVRMFNRNDGSPGISLDVNASHVYPMFTNRGQGQQRQQYQPRQQQQEQRSETHNQPDMWGDGGSTTDDDIPF